MKHGSTTSLRSQISSQLSEQQQVKAIQSDQRGKHQQARFWLVGWVLWHITLCRLFNAKSIFMQIVLFHTIQFSMNTQFVKIISISSYSVYLNSSNSAKCKVQTLFTVKCQNNSILNNSV